ncbi:MAG: DUF1761 domain-containing protein [Alphaproteobacteria bacterium]|nr:DUF1761 domain-containing protein [Alphaproteobacteria bacterium]
MAEFHFNYLAGIVSFILAFIIGGMWYSPKVFGKIWLASLGYDPKTRGVNPAVGFVIQIASTTLKVVLVGIVVFFSTHYMAWLIPLYIVTHFLKDAAGMYWSGQGWRLIALSAGCELVVDIVIMLCFLFIPQVF